MYSEMLPFNTGSLLPFYIVAAVIICWFFKPTVMSKWLHIPGLLIASALACLVQIVVAIVASDINFAITAPKETKHYAFIYSVEFACSVVIVFLMLQIFGKVKSVE
jgi:hypothetical protein